MEKDQGTPTEIELTQDSKNELKEKIDHLLDVAPNDSTIKSRLTKTRSGYRGVLEIISIQGKFLSVAKARNIDMMIRSLVRRMHRRLKIWRKNRFLPAR